MKLVFDYLACFWIFLGALFILIGKINYKSSKENFGTRYYRYCCGVCFLYSAFLEVFNIINSFLLISGISIIFLIKIILTWFAKKKLGEKSEVH
ncbi:MAG: hypothetical protein K0R54_1364 [Clostridiaceae bacterium]|nr:hypothetical protein [Clostridiaceae bacterium]